MQVSTPLPPNVPVEIILSAQPGPSARAYCLPAIVTRCSKEEIGLMFERIEPETWVALLSRLTPHNSEDVQGIEKNGRGRCGGGIALVKKKTA